MDKIQLCVLKVKYMIILDHWSSVTAKSIRPRIRSPGLNPLANPILGTNPLAYPIRPRIVFASGFYPLPRIRSPVFLLSTLQNQSYLHCYYESECKDSALHLVSFILLHARMQTAVNIHDFLDCYSWP